MDKNSKQSPPANDINRRGGLGILEYMPGSRSLRYSLTREKFLESFKAMIWVVPLTLLIWIYSEREQIVYPNSPNASDIEVNFKSSNPDRIVEPVDNPQSLVKVNLKLTGPQEAIEKVKDAWNQRVPRGVKVDTGDTLPNPNLPIRIVDRIQDDPDLKAYGVTVVESQPADIAVNIDNKKHLELPVEISRDDQPKLSPQTRFDPPKVTIEGPGRLLAKNQLHVYADLSLATLKTTGEQPPQTISVKLSAPELRGITITPGKVVANLVVKASDITEDIDAIPIKINATLATLHDFDIDIVNVTGGDGRSVGNVTVTGPPDLIKQMQEHTATPAPIAVLDISSDDAFRQDEPKTLRFELPPGVHESPSDTDRKVSFKMTTRKPAVPAG